MFRKPSSDDSGEELLGRALRAVPDPEITTDFNSRIHQALKQQPIERLDFWRLLRPGAFAAGGSFAVTLALLSLFGGSVNSSAPTDTNRLSTATSARVDRLSAVETFIEGADLTSASLRTVICPTPAAAPAAVPGSGAARPLRGAPSVHPLQGA